MIWLPLFLLLFAFWFGLGFVAVVGFFEGWFVGGVGLFIFFSLNWWIQAFDSPLLATTFSGKLTDLTSLSDPWTEAPYIEETHK